MKQQCDDCYAEFRNCESEGFRGDKDKEKDN
jgi:hypothetical protein